MELHKKQQGQIFKNSFLESLTKSNPTVSILFYILVILTFLLLNYIYTYNELYHTGILYGAGLFSWTILEYILHRYIFHIDDFIPAFKRFHYIIHGVHHKDPRSRERVFVPLVPGTIFAVSLFLLLYLLLDLNAFAFMAGLSNGYLIYSYIHYSVHTKPVFYPLRSLWKHHALHHYKYNDKAFGVSTRLWDHIFKTMPPKKDNLGNN